MKPIELSELEWESLKAQLVAEHGIKITISWVLRRELGFTVRFHRDSPADWKPRILLDFYDESMRTFFLLKYELDQ